MPDTKTEEQIKIWEWAPITSRPKFNVKFIKKMASNLKKGDIIKRKLNTGLLVGSLKVIDDVEEHGVYAHDIPINSIGSAYYKLDSISPINHLSLRIPNKEIEEIIEQRLDWVQHEANKSWEDALHQFLTADVKKPIAVITLVSAKSHLIVTEPVFRKIRYNGKKYIRLSFLRILESIVR